MSTPSKSTGPKFFLPALALLFIGLKLTGHIAWSWWWVLAPLWGPFAVLVLVCAVMVLIALLQQRVGGK